MTFIRVVDLQCDQDTDNDKDDLAERVSGVPQQSALIEQLPADGAKKPEHPQRAPCYQPQLRPAFCSFK